MREIKPPLSITLKNAKERGVDLTGWVRDELAERYYEPADYARWKRDCSLKDEAKGDSDA